MMAFRDNVREATGDSELLCLWGGPGMPANLPPGPAPEAVMVWCDVGDQSRRRMWLEAPYGPPGDRNDPSPIGSRNYRAGHVWELTGREVMVWSRRMREWEQKKASTPPRALHAPLPAAAPPLPLPTPAAALPTVPYTMLVVFGPLALLAAVWWWRR